MKLSAEFKREDSVTKGLYLRLTLGDPLAALHRFEMDGGHGAE